MKNLLVAVLTDRYPEKLERCLLSIDNQNADVGSRIVVCNTLDSGYIPMASQVAKKYGWDFIVTESNGACSKGKNSVLDYFAAKTDYKYLTQIDGDDYFEPGSLAILERIANKYDPDVIGVIGNNALYNGNLIPLVEWEESNDNETKSLISSKNTRKLILLYERAKKLIQFNRFVLVSRRCLPFFRFSENIRISDIQLSIRLKEAVNRGLLKYFILESDSVYTYDADDFGCFRKFLGEDFDLNTKVFWEELEGLDVSGEIPIIRDDNDDNRN